MISYDFQCGHFCMREAQLVGAGVGLARAMQEINNTRNAISFSAAIFACVERCRWEQALALLGRCGDKRDTKCYQLQYGHRACLQLVGQTSTTADVTSLSAAISACEKGGQ